MEGVAQYPVQGAQPPWATPSPPLRHLANELAPPAVHSTYTSSVTTNTAVLHRGASPNPGGAEVVFSTLWQVPGVTEWLELPQGPGPTLAVGATPCATNFYLNLATNAANQTNWNTVHLTPRDCGGAAPHLAAWVDYQDLHTPTSAVLEYGGGYLAYVVFRILQPPGGGIVSSTLYYQGTATSIAAPGGYNYRVCGTPGDDVWHCSPMLWVGDPALLWEDTFNDGEMLNPPWEVLVPNGLYCPDCWGIEAFELGGHIELSDPYSVALIAAGNPSWADYTAVVDLRYTGSAYGCEALRLRFETYPFRYYEVSLCRVLDEGASIKLDAVNGGAGREFGAMPLADFAAGVTYRLQADVHGNHIRVYFGRAGDVLGLSFDEIDTAAYATAGRIGLRISEGGDGQEHAAFDDVRVYR